LIERRLKTVDNAVENPVQGSRMMRCRRSGLHP
jgi:hypothetical protein